MQQLTNGANLGAYKIIRLVGRGGMGEVYEAYETKLHRRVALKIIAPSQPDEHDFDDLFRRFLQEARTLAQVNHPNIVTIYAIDRIQDSHFIAMEFVEGLSLRQVRKEIPLTTDEAIPFFLQILEGLKCLHNNHIIHRDIKPHNILLRNDGQIKILDFGIAKHMLPGFSEKTSAGVVAGTIPYMAPELKVGVPAHVGSDIWSLGAIFYELLVGKPLALVMMKRPDDKEIFFSEKSAELIPEEMRTIIRKMCSFERNNRHLNCQAVMDDLRQLAARRPPLAAERHAAVIRALASIAEQNRKDTAGEISITSLKNTPLNTISPSGDSRTVIPRAGRKKQNRWWIGAAVVALVAVVGLVAGIKALNKSKQEAQHSDGGEEQDPLAPALLLFGPKDHEVLWLDTNRVPTFVWTKNVNSRQYRIQIATDEHFKSLIVDEPAYGASFRPERVIPEGNYFWRLHPADKQGAVVGPNQFTIAQPKPVVLTSPGNGKVLDLFAGMESMNVDFNWKCDPNSKFYRIQISLKPDFKVMEIEQTLPVCEFKTSSLKMGEYFWRVRQEDTGNVQSPWSEARSIKIRKGKAAVEPAFAVEDFEIPNPFPKVKIREPKPSVVAKLTAPRSSGANFDFEISYSGKPRDLASLQSNLDKFPKLKWQEVPGAEGYQIEISGNAEFGGDVVTETVDETEYEWKEVTPGKYFWHVRALNSGGKPGPFSKTSTFKALLPKPKLKDSFKIVRMTGKVEPMFIEWDPLPLAEKYVVLVGKRRDLAGAEEKIVTAPKLAVENPPGNYFVRVVAANNAKQFISAISDSKPLEVQVRTALEKPSPLTPGNGKGAPASDGKISIVFTWSGVKMAQGYTIEIAADPDFKNIMTEENTPYPVLVLKKAKLKGRIYWRVRAEGVKGASEWSSPFHFDVR
jgi:serine/threonine protein kinase